MLTSAGVPTNDPTIPAAIPIPAFVKKLGGSPFGLKSLSYLSKFNKIDIINNKKPSNYINFLKNYYRMKYNINFSIFYVLLFSFFYC